MKLVKLWVLAAFAILAFAAVGTTAASAETSGLLCLTSGCASELEGTLESMSVTPELVTLSGKTLTAVKATATIKGCEAEGTEKKDLTLCKDQKLNFTGVKNGKLPCQTEGAAKEEVVLLLDEHAAAELNAAGTELEPLLLAKVLNAKLESPLVIKCSVGTIEVKGTVACLVLPGLVEIPAGNMVEILCKINASHDPETGKCEVLCEWLEKEPLESNFSGKFEDSWQQIHLLGTFNKAIFLDD